MKKTSLKVVSVIIIAILSSATIISCGPQEEPSIPVTGVSISKTSLNLTEEETETLTATVTPADATNKNVNWSSSNTSIATVDATGKVTAVGAGTANITVATADGGKTASCSVTVTALHRPLSKIEISPAKTEVAFGTPSTLKITYTPENATNKKVTWKSSDESIATVSSGGVVEGLKDGTVTITATSDEGKLTAKCEVTITSLTKAGLYYLQGRDIYKDGKLFFTNSYVNPTINLDGNIYYYSDGKVFVNGVTMYQYSINSVNGYETAAGGGYYFIANTTNSNSDLSVWKINPVKKTAKLVSIHKGKSKHEVWVEDMAADSKGNLYIAGHLTREDGVHIATLWKLDTSDKVTATSYSDGTGIKVGPTVDAVAVNKNDDVFCLVYEGEFSSSGYYIENLYKNGKKQYAVTKSGDRSYSESCDIAVNGNDVYSVICEYGGKSNSSCVKVYKNKNRLYTVQPDENTNAGDIAVTSKGDVYFSGHTGSGSNIKTYIWKNGEIAFTSNRIIPPHSMFVKE